MSILNAFRSWFSIFHFFIGVVCGLNIHPLLSLFVFIVFFFYEMLEKESEQTTINNYVEFLIGYVCGDIVGKALPFLVNILIFGL